MHPKYRLRNGSHFVRGVSGCVGVGVGGGGGWWWGLEVVVVVVGGGGGGGGGWGWAWGWSGGGDGLKELIGMDSRRGWGGMGVEWGEEMG